MAETIVVIKDIVVILAAITTIFVALIGIYSWKRELRGRTNYDAAKKLREAMYKMRESLYASQKYITAYWKDVELPESHAYRRANIFTTYTTTIDTGWKHSHKDKFQVVIDEFHVALKEFHAAAYVAESLWGTDIYKLCVKFNESSWNLCESLYKMELAEDENILGNEDTSNITVDHTTTDHTPTHVPCINMSSKMIDDLLSDSDSRKKDLLLAHIRGASSEKSYFPPYPNKGLWGNFIRSLNDIENYLQGYLR